MSPRVCATRMNPLSWMAAASGSGDERTNPSIRRSLNATRIAPTPPIVISDMSWSGSTPPSLATYRVNWSVAVPGAEMAMRSPFSALRRWGNGVAAVTPALSAASLEITKPTENSVVEAAMATSGLPCSTASITCVSPVFANCTLPPINAATASVPAPEFTTLTLTLSPSCLKYPLAAAMSPGA